MVTGSMDSIVECVTYPDAWIQSTASRPESNQIRTLSVQLSIGVSPPAASASTTCWPFSGTVMKLGSPYVSLSWR